MNAFTGILSALENHSSWNLTHGLPEQLMNWALLWVPAGHHQRRPPPKSGSLLHFSSWSWVGWIGPITFNVAFTNVLIPLRSLLERLEVEIIRGNDSRFRTSLRIILDKGENHHTQETFAEAQPGKLPNLDNMSSLAATSASTLHFTAMTVCAAAFRIKMMPPWEWNFLHFDTRARVEQCGLFITLDDEIVGFLPGTSMEFLSHYQWSRLKLLAISEFVETWEMWRM
jgi:hypothetical protein